MAPDPRPRWLSRADFIRTVLPNQADAKMTADLIDLLAEAPDDAEEDRPTS